MAKKILAGIGRTPEQRKWRDLLGENGYQVTVAGNDAEILALLAFSGVRYDFLLLEDDLPSEGASRLLPHIDRLEMEMPVLLLQCGPCSTSLIRPNRNAPFGSISAATKPEKILEMIAVLLHCADLRASEQAMFY